MAKNTEKFSEALASSVDLRAEPSCPLEKATSGYERSPHEGKCALSSLRLAFMHVVW